VGGLEASRDRVDVWWCTPAELSGPDAVAAAEALLTPDERAEQGKFQATWRRQEFLATRVLVRAALSLYAGVAPADWRFARSAHGKPELSGPASAPPLRFSLSNTAGLVACGVTTEQELGVDVEDTTRSVAMLELADRNFAPAEVASLRALPEARRSARFFEIWTLKEAYVKARGRGLGIPLEQFSFQLEGSEAVRLACDAGFDDERAWQFRLFRLLDRFTLAVGVRHEGSNPAEVRVQHLDPLAGLGVGSGRR
jgi:4'-phosphopantetheinyl transferase